MGLPDVRVSDADRERVADWLRDHSAAGRISFDELSERLDLVYAARTQADLDAVAVDLPPLAATPAPPRRHRRWLVAIMGGSDRVERVVPEHTVIVDVMGGSDLDLRHAEFQGEATVTCVAIMGGTDIYVPEGVAVEMSGLALMGGNDNRVPPVPYGPDTPVLRVRAFSLMGGIDVWGPGARRRWGARRSSAPEMPPLPRGSGRRRRL